MRRALLAVLAASLLAPAAAAAQQPAPPPPAPPAPAPSLVLAAEGTMRAGDDLVVLQGAKVVLRGQLTPAVAGQVVELRLHRNGRRYKRLRLPIAPDGTFATTVRPRRAGRLSVRAHHGATPQLGALESRKIRVAVAPPAASTGMSGPLVRILQRRLDRLGYAVSRSGTYDDATGRAVMAYRKVNGFARRFDASRGVVRRVLAGKGAFRPRHPDAGRHVEADLSRQVLALVDGGKVVDTYHTSTGAPATPTVIGTFRVYRKDPGTNSLGMVRSSYFIRGYAIHGYAVVPAFNASHGCLRVPIPDSARIYTWLRMGDRVIVYP
jgi:hypothetical protein